MGKVKRTPAGQILTDFILDFFRLNSRMLASGDRLVAGLGLTSARWQILGAIVAAGQPQPVAWIARDLGANRQNVQRIVNDLETEGLVRFDVNPHHRRAQLVVLTDNGKQAFDAAMDLQTAWANQLSNGLSVDDLEAMRRVVAGLRRNLDEIDGGDSA
ncbi:MarR family winged helix-turn-helix transcriptional regulator [Burkholderia sp. PU8-34]